jgi:uncharacterized membrane protein YqiK
MGDEKRDSLAEIAAKASAVYSKAIAAGKAMRELDEAMAALNAATPTTTYVFNCGSPFASDDAFEDSLVKALNRAAKRGVMPRFTRKDGDE